MNKVAYTIMLLFLAGRISSYHPGKDGSSGTRLAGARCLLEKKYWDWKDNYPWPVCAMRAGCSTGQIRMGDIALVKRKGWSHWCVVLDSGPWNAVNDKGEMKNCSPKSKYKGKPPPGFRWKSIIDIASPPKGYPGGGPGHVTVLHWQAKKKVRRQIVLDLLD